LIIQLTVLLNERKRAAMAFGRFLDLRDTRFIRMRWRAC
jgi:hypothetical protein